MDKGHGGRKDKGLTKFLFLLVGIDHLHQVLQLLKMTLLHHTVSLVDCQISRQKRINFDNGSSRRSPSRTKHFKNIKMQINRMIVGLTWCQWLSKDEDFRLESDPKDVQGSQQQFPVPSSKFFPASEKTSLPQRRLPTKADRKSSLCSSEKYQTTHPTESTPSWC